MQTYLEKSGRERFLLHKREATFMALYLSLFVCLGGTLRVRTDDPDLHPVMALVVLGLVVLLFVIWIIRERAKIRRKERSEGPQRWPFDKYRYNAKFKAVVYLFFAVVSLVVAGRYYFLPDSGMYIPNSVTVGAGVTLAVCGLVRVLVILRNLSDQRAIHEHESRNLPPASGAE